MARYLCLDCYEKNAFCFIDRDRTELSYTKMVCEECGKKTNIVVNPVAKIPTGKRLK